MNGGEVPFNYTKPSGIGGTNGDLFDTLVSEIESSGGSCANVIRRLCELERESTERVSSSSRAVLASFLRQLDAGINHRDQEIERMCNHHYQGFVDSIRELMQVREDAERLRGQLGETGGAVDAIVKQIQSRCEELARTQDTIENIYRSIEALQVCLPILEQYAHVQKSIDAKRFYPALKSLEYLEHSQIPLIANYAFADALTKKIPQMRADIKTASLSELTDFLENIRKHSVRLGAVSMKQTAEKTGMDPGALMGGYVKSATNVSGLPIPSHGKMRRAPPPPVPSRHVNPFTGTVDTQDALEKELEELVSVPAEDNDDDPDAGNMSNVEDLVDLGAVYRCLHIHSVLGIKAEFEKYYRNQRKKQWQLNFSLSPAAQESLRSYCEFFSTIVGFFVVEDCIRHTVPNVATKSYLDDLWTGTMKSLLGIIRTNAEKVADSEVLLRLKDYCVLFGRTMRSLGFSVAGLKEMTDEVWRRYQNLLASEWEDKFKEIFSRDDYTAIQVQVADDYQLILDMYPCQAPEFDVLPFPKSLSFSMMVPRIFQAVKEYINVCRKFTDNLDLSQTELEDMVNKATNILFSSSLTRCMTVAIRSAKTNLLRLIQLSVNMDELETACARLEEHIQLVVTGMPVASSSSSADTLEMMPRGAPPRSRLHGMSLFKDTRSEAESQIYATINSKIDEFISLADYDWMMESEPQRPTDYMQDLTEYLNGTFRSFTNLPPKVAQTACISSCKYISQSLDRMILSSGQVRMMSEFAVQQVSLDLAVCEEFARRDPVPGVDSSTLLLTFTDLRQLLDVTILEDWATFFKDYGQPGHKYDRVTPGNAIKLVEKLREADKKKSSFIQSMMRQERDKRRRIDDVLRQLRDLQNSVYSR